MNQREKLEKVVRLQQARSARMDELEKMQNMIRDLKGQASLEMRYHVNGGTRPIDGKLAMSIINAHMESEQAEIDKIEAELVSYLK
jgi:hypothetical protein